MQTMQLIQQEVSQSRNQAIAAGDLVDVSEAARLLGWTEPMVLSKSVYADCVAWEDADTHRKKSYQEPAKRLATVLSQAMLAKRSNLPAAKRLNFTAQLVPRNGSTRDAKAFKLHLAHTPGHGFTIVMHGED